MRVRSPPPGPMKKTKPCKHRMLAFYADSNSSVALATTKPIGYRCAHCGEYTSLGESNDSGRAVATEVHAARMAAKFHPLEGETDAARFGWSYHEKGYFPLYMLDGLNMWRDAGYLARCIVHGAA